MRGASPLQWNELRPYPPGSPGGLAVLMDHIPEFVLVVSRQGGRITIHARVAKKHVPLLCLLEGVEPVPSGPPRTSGFPFCRTYSTMRHTALPVSPRGTTRASIYRLLADSVGGDAYVMVSAKKAARHPQVSGYIRRTERGYPPDAFWGTLAEFAGISSKPGPAASRNLREAREKAASRHLFRCHIVVAAGSVRDGAAIESVFPSMSLKRAASPSRRRLDALSSRGPGMPALGGDRSPVLSDEEILSFLSLPDNEDMAAVPMNFGMMESRSGGERAEPADATSIDIGRDYT